MNELTAYWSEDRFVLDTYRQVQKDLLGLAELELSEDRLLEDPYPVLQAYILEIIDDLTKSHDDKLAQFIYKVDLPERKFHRLIGTGNLEDLSHEILRREAQKVYLRRKFST